MSVRFRRRVIGLAAAFCVLAAAPSRGQGPAGPVQAGDRILLHVVGEPRLTDTFTVGPGPTLALPGLAAVALAGVSRDSVAGHLTAYLGQYLTHPAVQAQVLLRLGVIGEAGRPGFYALPAGAVLQDLIMAAGGMTPEARFDRADLVRADDVLLRGPAIRRAMADGRTLDALGLRSGDALRIPRRPDQESRVRILTALVTLPLAIYGVTRIF